ncbi:MAG: alpha/beta fold hydrolase [Candidatus Melainabacteria bacterium]|nr:alpha/beta fold hydrolase [Candidatus Melainabacteria bacterium]
MKSKSLQALAISLVLASNVTLAAIAQVQPESTGETKPEPYPAPALKAGPSSREACNMVFQGKYKEALDLCLAEMKTDNCHEDAKRIAGICYCHMQDSAKAQTIFEELLKQDPESADKMLDLAASLYQQGKYQAAYKLCAKAATYSNCKAYGKSIAYLTAAECLYADNKLSEAAKTYQASLDSLNKNVGALVAKFALSGLAGCYWQQKMYKEAATTYEELAKISRSMYGEFDVDYGWSIFQLSEAYEKLADPRCRGLAFKSIWIFRKANLDRLSEEYKNILTDDEKGQQLKERLARFVFGESSNQEYAFTDRFLMGPSKYYEATGRGVVPPLCAWRYNTRKAEPPGWVWSDPRVEQTALLICVHGLGLHHRSYESFAKRIQREGVTTVSFDVRGFGSYLDARGHDRLNMEDCVSDLENLVGVLRKDNPKVPLFLLGESMGGAIVMRLAARKGKLIDGLICSVPSGSRYRSHRQALSVGLHFLKNKNRPFDIGTRIVNQATSESRLRESWSNDPSSRLRLSPQELLEFQHFMDKNVEFAKQITETPVIIFQGDDDKLVKKTGTYDLFESVANPKKTLVMLGETEHLIFEAGQFKEDVTMGVLGWMSAHSQRKEKTSNKLKKSVSEN